MDEGCKSLLPRSGALRAAIVGRVSGWLEGRRGEIMVDIFMRLEAEGRSVEGQGVFWCQEEEKNMAALNRQVQDSCEGISCVRRG